MLFFSRYRYELLFDYFEEFLRMAFRVVADDYVTIDSGTGIVHCYAVLAEDDYRVCIASGVVCKVWAL